jgi:non-ribosomal peptide synthetase component F
VIRSPPKDVSLPISRGFKFFYFSYDSYHTSRNCNSIAINASEDLDFSILDTQVSLNMTQLPDPTMDLDWSGYTGSIQEHFSENAEKYPDRPCVIETKSSESPERVFTYKQIYEASNVVAHYLRDAGISNGDVVMIWAHRSVDLVVAMMGTLVCL